MGKMLFFSVFFLVGMATALPSTREKNRIVGGNPTTIQQYPYVSNMQLLRYGIIWSQECGGTLITTRTILSTAHCFAYYRDVSDPSWFWRVRLGSSYSSSGGTIHQISRFIIHENYNHPSPLNNDVAIVRLLNPAVLSDSVRVALIAGSNYNLPDGTTVVATGWGDVMPGGPSSEQLRHVNLNIVNQNLCVQRYAHLKSESGNEDYPNVTPGMVCTGILNVGGRDTCQGDSGGPIIHNNSAAGHVIMGITSWGFSCGHYYYPGVSVRVSVHAEWIVANGSV